ncbi:DEAD/DEAH box RNA helicase family protein [Wolffia australiana]
METDSDSGGSHVSATPPRRSPPLTAPPKLSSSSAAPVKRKLLSKVDAAPCRSKKIEKPMEQPEIASSLLSPDCSCLPFRSLKIPGWNNPAASLSSSFMSRKVASDLGTFELVEIAVESCVDPEKIRNEDVGEVNGFLSHSACETFPRLFSTDRSDSDFRSRGGAIAPENQSEEGSRVAHHPLSQIRKGKRVSRAQTNWISGPSGMTMKEAPKPFKSSNDGNFVKLNLNAYGRKKFKFRNGNKQFASSRNAKFRRRVLDKNRGAASKLDSEIDFFGSGTSSTFDESTKQDGGAMAEAILAVREDCSDINLQKLLKLSHGYDSFREGQLKAIKQILGGKSTILVLPTGAGKTLCYQLPALVLSGLTLVISPLISLMMDQIRQLPPLLSGGLFCSNQNLEEYKETLDRILHGRLKVLLISPERFTDPKFLRIFEDGPEISLIVVDEAHCLSEWSHNFRPSYFRLRSSLFRKKLSVNCVLAMTATATTQTLEDIMQSLDIKSDNLIQGGSMRDNLELYVTESENKVKGLLMLLKSSPFSEVQSIIIYCKFQAETDTVCSFLCDNGISAKSYHSGIPAKNRSRTQDLFCLNKIRVVVATVAFGMGLDKRDVGAVIHYSLPESLEEYVQETGRAGRDGRLSFCHLFHDDNTYYKLRSLLHSDGTDEYTMKSFLCHILYRKSNSPGETFSLVKESTCVAFDMKEEVLLTVLTQLELGEVQYLRLLPATNITCTLHFHKRDPYILSDKSIVIAAILSQVEQKHGQYIFDIPTVANSLRTTPIELLDQLQNLKYSGEITYETKDPAFCYTITQTPEDVVSLATELTKWLRQVEQCKIRKLDAMYSAAVFATKKCIRTEGCSSSLHSQCMRKRIIEYFNLTPGDSPTQPPTKEANSSGNPFLRADIKVFLQSNTNIKFTPRAVARIMHGIPSPAYPYSTWAKTHFWGRHSRVDFPVVMQAATLELMNLTGRGTI